MTDYNGLKKIAQQNVLSTDEACEILGRTRQQLNNYIKSGRLEILKSTKNGNLFWRPDVFFLSKQIHQERIREHHEILGGSTSQATQAAKNLNLNPREISEIYVFFEEKDAIEKNFYCLETLETPDTLIAIQAPNFVFHKRIRGFEKDQIPGWHLGGVLADGIVDAVLFGIAFQPTNAGLADLHAGHTPVLPQKGADALLALGCLGLVQPKRRFYRPENGPGRQLGGRDHNVE